MTDCNENVNEKSDYLSRILALVPGHIYWKDCQGVYLGCNDQQAKTLGFKSGQEIVGKTDYDLPWHKEAASLIAIDQQVIATKRTHVAEEPVTLPNGEEAVFLSYKVPLPDSAGNIIGVVGASLDITEKIRLEKSLAMAKERAEISNVLKTEFMRNMQHDIRTPLVGIWGMAMKLAKQIDGAASVTEDLQDIKHCVEELLSYCDEILDYTNIEIQDLPNVSKSFELRGLIHRIIMLNQPAAQDKQLKIIFEDDVNVPNVVIGDEFRLYRILLNLVSNGVKFTREGSVKIIIKADKGAHDKVVIKFYIHDTGIGIPKDKQAYIYDSYFRVNQSNQGRYKGLGLGLKIVKQFVEDLNGKITLKSIVGQGSTFVCMIPFQVPILPVVDSEVD